MFRTSLPTCARCSKQYSWNMWSLRNPETNDMCLKCQDEVLGAAAMLGIINWGKALQERAFAHSIAKQSQAITEAINAFRNNELCPKCPEARYKGEGCECGAPLRFQLRRQEPS